MARSTRLVILIKNIYTLWGRKRFLLPVTYFPTNLVYPFTLQVTGIIICYIHNFLKGLSTLLNQKWFNYYYYYYCYLFFINIFFNTELINLYSLFAIKQPHIDCFRGDSQAIYYPWSLLFRNSFQGLTIRTYSLTSMVFSSLYYFFNVFSCPTPLNFSSPQSNHFISRPQINPDQS